MWFTFEDTWSGGYKKTEYDWIFIEAVSEELAVKVFEEHFTHAFPYGESCECCTPDFDISSSEGCPPTPPSGRIPRIIYIGKDGIRGRSPSTNEAKASKKESP